MKEVLLGLACVLALIGVGCHDDDEDYSYQTENCTTVDYGDGEVYELCCQLRCYGEYDYDDFYERCDEDYSCASSIDHDCPSDVVEENGYPDCIY